MFHGHLIALRIYWGAASKPVSTGINFTAQRSSLHGCCSPPSTGLSGNIWYLKADSAGGSVFGLTEGFALITF